ncbi:hypothetical protein CLOBL_02500 [Clostridium sp. BL-8]|nr:hypothetical protein CLOBL_02500 [Clostridium sp. BL-8]
MVIGTGISKEEIKESFKLYSTMELMNIKPIGTPYKSKALLGDKIWVDILDDDTSQYIAYLVLEVGIEEMNVRSFGFREYR